MEEEHQAGKGVIPNSSCRFWTFKGRRHSSGVEQLYGWSHWEEQEQQPEGRGSPGVGGTTKGWGNALERGTGVGTGQALSDRRFEGIEDTLRSQFY